MNCIKAQSYITPFINNKLNLQETEEFIDHINTCPVCKEELEVYYALLTAMKQLDEDKNLYSDFGLKLSQKLENAQERIIHAKFTYYRKKAILVFTILIVVILFSFRYAYKSIEFENSITESNFQIRKPFHENRYNQLSGLLDEYITNQEANGILEPMLHEQK